jgi:hypothetical protein
LPGQEHLAVRALANLPHERVKPDRSFKGALLALEVAGYFLLQQNHF